MNSIHVYIYIYIYKFSVWNFWLIFYYICNFIWMWICWLILRPSARLGPEGRPLAPMMAPGHQLSWFWDARGSFGGHSGVALGHFGVIVASLWCDFGVMRGALWAYGRIGSLWVTLGLLWPHFKSIVGSLLGYEGGFVGLGGCFGVALSSLWAHFWHIRRILGCLWCHFGCMKVSFQKLLISLMNFNEFM